MNEEEFKRVGGALEPNLQLIQRHFLFCVVFLIFVGGGLQAVLFRGCFRFCAKD